MSASTPSQPRTTHGASQGRVSGASYSPILIDDDSSSDERESDVKGKRAKREDTSSGSSSSDSDDSLPTALELISSSRRKPHSSVSDWLASSPASSSSRAPAQTPTRSARPALARVNSNDKKKARRLAPKVEPSASSSTTRPMTKTEPKSSQTSSGIGVGGRELKPSRDEGLSQVSEREQMGRHRQKVEPDATPSSSSSSQHPASRSSQPTALVKSEPHRSSLTSPSPAGNGRSRNPFRTPIASSSSRAGYEQKPSLGPRGAKMEMDEDDRLARIREWSRQASFAPPSSSSISRGQPGAAAAAAAAASRRQGQLVAPPQPQSHSPLPLPPASGAAVALASQPQPAAAPWMHAQDAPSSSRPILASHPPLQSHYPHYHHHHQSLYPPPPPYAYFGPVGLNPFMSGNNAAEAMPQMPGSFELPHLHDGPSAADLSAAATAQQHAAAGTSTTAINPSLLANGLHPIMPIDGATTSTGTPATDANGIPLGDDATAAAPTAWAASSVAANVLGGLGNGTVEANPDALKQIFISDEEAISDMANLKPVPLSALDYLKKHGLVTQLKPHQSTALRFLIESEHRSPPQEDKEQKCLFKRINLRPGAHGYVNIVNGEWTTHEPEMPRGCILADAMGLGKTLSVLALIISPPDGVGFLHDDDKGKRGAGTDSDDSDDDDGPGPSSYSRRKSTASASTKGTKRATAFPDSDDDEEAAEYREALASKKLKQSKHLTKKSNGTGRTGSAGGKKDPIVLSSSDDDSDSDAGPSKRSDKKKPVQKSSKKTKPDPLDTQATTLVICPLSVLSNWTDQIEVHCPRVRVGVLYGDEGKKLLAQKDWSRYDVIVSTYDTVKNAYRSIDLLKNHELREADFQERRKEIEDTLRQYRKLERDTIRRGNGGGADMAQAYKSTIEGQERALAELDEEIAKARMCCPKQGGKTDWKKEAACLKRLAKLRGEDTSAQKKGKGKKTSPDSDSDWVVDDSDSDASSIARNGNAGMADYFDPANFDRFKSSDLLYVWANMRLKQGQTRIFEQEWLRVCLDEAHVVRNKGTLAYSAVWALKAERKVAITGTPIVNGSGDLGSLAAFIGLYPFSRVPKLFAERIDNPIKKARDGASQAMNLLKAICKDLVCLRTKDMKVDGKLLVDLPTIEHFRYDIRLKKEDEEFYARAEEALRRMLKIWMEEEQLGAQRLVCILVFLCRMRQLACDRRLVPATLIDDIEAAAEEEDDEGKVKKTQSQLRAILIAMTANGDDCPVCMEPLPGAASVPIVTPCGHCFHKECLATSLATSPKCPMDRRAINMSQVLELPETEGEEVEDAGLGDGAKIDALMEIIGNIKAAHPTDKILVFSNFASFLGLIAKRLEVEEIDYAEFYGSHSRRQRDETLRQFRRPLREPDAAEAAAAAAARAAAQEQAKLRDQIRAAAADDESILAALDRADFDAVPTRNASSSSSGARGSSSRRPPPPRVLLLSIQAGGVGLNLTEANHVVLTDPWWQGAIEAQAIDRAHRIGQKKPVKVYRLVSNATVEDRVVQVAQEKMQLAAEALGGLQYKGAQLFKGKASTKSRIKDIAKLFGLSMNNGASASGSGSGGSAQVRGPPNRRRS